MRTCDGPLRTKRVVRCARPLSSMVVLDLHTPSVVSAMVTEERLEDSMGEARRETDLHARMCTCVRDCVCD